MEVSRDVVTDRLVDFGKNSFLKIPIDRYMGLLGIEPNPPQIALINSINDPQYRFVTAALARRTGKSFISNVIGQCVVFMPGSSVLIIAPNYQLSSISWEIQRSLIKKFGIETERSNAKDKIIELANTSTIRMGSVSTADSIVGRSYDLIIFDEAALNPDGLDVFNIQLRPTLDKVNSKAIFISTPRGFNWFKDIYDRGFSEYYEKWVTIRSTWRDNPRADPKDIEDARRTMSLAQFQQEFECSFVALEGVIYNFDINKHVVDIDIDTLDLQEKIAGIDIGFRNATAFVVVGISGDGQRLYILDEYYRTARTTREHGLAIKKLVGKYDIDYTYIDSAAQQTKFDLATDYDVSTFNAKKSILDGIGYIASLIDNDRLVVNASCKSVIQALSYYRWELEGKERPLHDENSDMADAIRYALYSHKANIADLVNE